MAVGILDVVIDFLDQVFHAAEGSTSDSFGSEFSKPPFHQIQPTGTRRHKVREKTRMSFEPGLHLGMLVCPVVVHHEVQGGLAGKLLVPAVAETLRIPGAGAVCNIDQRPCLGGLPTRQRAWSCRCVCSRES